MPRLLIILMLIVAVNARGQELFVSTEPASNIPAKSLSARLSGQYVAVDRVYDRPAQRYKQELLYGVNKNLMVEGGITFSNMHTSHFQYESFNVYAKYRFLSKDEVHQHFRMAAFITGSKTAAPFHYDEAGLMGDKTGAEVGLITTQLWNRFALSGTIAHLQLLDASRFSKVVYIPERFYGLMNYSLSTGYLLLPKTYTNYKQVNLNVYVEALAQQTVQEHKYFIDLAPAVQAVFFSTTKLNVSHRFQLSSTMDRMTRNSWMISLERNFLNVGKKR